MKRSKVKEFYCSSGAGIPSLVKIVMIIKIIVQLASRWGMIQPYDYNAVDVGMSWKSFLSSQWF